LVEWEEEKKNSFATLGRKLYILVLSYNLNVPYEPDGTWVLSCK